MRHLVLDVLLAPGEAVQRGHVEPLPGVLQPVRLLLAPHDLAPLLDLPV